jgi:hypothetical protein
MMLSGASTPAPETTPDGTQVALVRVIRRGAEGKIQGLQMQFFEAAKLFFEL